jgi:hypothetical protein
MSLQNSENKRIITISESIKRKNTKDELNQISKLLPKLQVFFLFFSFLLLLLPANNTRQNQKGSNTSGSQKQ